MENKTGFDVELKGLKEAIRKQLSILTEQLNFDTDRLLEYKEDHGDYFYRPGAAELPTDIQKIPHIERCRLAIKSALESVALIVRIEKDVGPTIGPEEEKEKKLWNPREALKEKRKDL